LDELINYETTTALVFDTAHPESAEAFIDVALAKKLRMICGKVAWIAMHLKTYSTPPHVATSKANP